jgi:ABC-2 type transport system ATP-binding protein
MPEDSITVSHLSKSFTSIVKEPGITGSLKSLIHPVTKTKLAVSDISFSIKTGELVGFIGPNGAGKTTTLKCLSGLLYPTRGQLRVQNFTPFERKSDFLRQISLVMGQKQQLWWDLPALESFMLNKEIYQISDAQYKKTLDQLVDILNVSKLLEIPVRRLSLGERMKMELIAALIHSPKILFLDEPTIGLDVVMQKTIREFIAEYNKIHEATILLTSHYMEDVRRLASRVIVIDHGVILFDGQFDNLIHEFAPYKIVTLVLDEEVSKDQLAKYGEVVSYNDAQVVLKVDRIQSKDTAAKLLAKLPVADVTIEEPDIEEVIRDVFTKKT